MIVRARMWGPRAVGWFCGGVLLVAGPALALLGDSPAARTWWAAGAVLAGALVLHHTEHVHLAVHHDGRLEIREGLRRRWDLAATDVAVLRLADRGSPRDEHLVPVQVVHRDGQVVTTSALRWDTRYGERHRREVLDHLDRIAAALRAAGSSVVVGP